MWSLHRHSGLSLASALTLSVCLLAVPLFAVAQQVGDNVTNPLNNDELLVTAELDGAVETESGLIIRTTTEVGDDFTDPADGVTVLTVSATSLNPDTNLVDTIFVADGRSFSVVEITNPLDGERLPVIAVQDDRVQIQGALYQRTSIEIGDSFDYVNAGSVTETLTVTAVETDAVTGEVTTLISDPGDGTDPVRVAVLEVTNPLNSQGVAVEEVLDDRASLQGALYARTSIEVGDTFEYVNEASVTETLIVTSVETDPVTGEVTTLIADPGDGSDPIRVAVLEVTNPFTSQGIAVEEIQDGRVSIQGEFYARTSIDVGDTFVYVDEESDAEVLTVTSVETDPVTGEVTALISEPGDGSDPIRVSVLEVTNPINRQAIAVEEVLDGAAGIDGEFIVRTTIAVGDTFTDPEDENNVLTVSAVTVNPDSGLVESITADGRDFPVMEITNPETGERVEVVQVLEGAVLTAGDLVIRTATELGDTFEALDADDNVVLYTITAVEVDQDTNLPILLTANPGALEAPVVEEFGSAIDEEEADPGNADTGGTLVIDIPTGNANVYADNQRGGNGANGRDGGGIRICIIGCFTIGINATAGGAGGTGPTIDATLGAGNGDIETVSDKLPGVVVSSVGGAGGTGGDGYGINIDGARGGTAGRGGEVSVVSDVDITTSGRLAYGIHVQSRSGNGGQAGSGYFASEGGTGGLASSGGTAQGTNRGAITTTGDGAIGLMVQSLGGAAGGGGDSYGITGEPGSALAGGDGGTARATNAGTIITTGEAAHGLLAQSVGGSGGDAGDSGGIAAFGNEGSGGGNGGTAEAFNADSASVTTLGEGAVGVFAQSIGGGGGNGSDAVGIAAFGSTGAAGGDGGTALVENGLDAQVTTSGDDAHGLFAQSIGGGGGSGGTGGGVAAYGGDGGGGGDGGSASVTARAGGAVTTSGQGAHAIFAQSVGGGGGTGGGSDGFVSMGASGERAGIGGKVDVVNDATLTTTGVDARGIFAQSVGGGGGAASGSDGVFSMGGAGGSGGAGGRVDVTNNGVVNTEGLGADAVYAQSIGGGGGSGASSGGLFSMGGAGESGGAGGTVVVTNSGSLTTSGELARGVLAQSIGGGGGTGGRSGGLASIGGSGGNASDAGAVTVTNDGVIATAGHWSTGIYAQSVGGGGGDGGSSEGFLSVGGSGGTGGDAGAVTVDQSGLITTTGDDAVGIFAEAVGGGGGNGGSSYSGGLAAGIAVGGDGGAAGDGGAVTVTLNDVMNGDEAMASTVSTAGARSTGILAQSVGGGGGNGGAAIQGTGSSFGAISSAVGGDGEAGGDGGVVTLTGNGNVITTGPGSTGVLLQSVGGGGGNGGTTVAGATQVGLFGGSVATTVGAEGGEGGAGNLVTSDFNGSVITGGDVSPGFIAQSVGGGGGNGGTTVAAAASAGAFGSGAASIGIGGEGGDGGIGGAVDVSIGQTGASSVSTGGDQSVGVLLQSVGGGGGNGGTTIAGAASGGGGGSGAVSTAVGGSGGDGGDAGSVAANISSDVTTAGSGSGGVIAQAIGGGGGNGGLTIGASVSGAGGVSGAVSTAVGGSGGLGGQGNTVSLTYAGAIETQQSNSVGLLVQSVGGGGGNGGGAIAATLSAAGGASGAISTGVGGAGGVAGDGGVAGIDLAVELDADGSVLTVGDNSGGIVAQSVGGGGGNGGYSITASGSLAGVGGAAVSVGIGGEGNAGGAGKGVDATSAADVTTLGDDSIGFIAQSIGGGGGNGGYNIGGSVSAAGGVSGAVTVGVGGAGDVGGNAGAVFGSSGGVISTAGDRSSGFVVQSIGGGGGNGGANIVGSGSAGGIGSGAVSGGVGGAGDGGGDGSTVTAVSSGDVMTAGANATGIMAQSVGGGGGSGGFNISGALSAAGAGSGVGSLGVGGAGAAGGDGDFVDLDVNNSVSTLGADSTAVVAQSVGGGGGNGGFNVTAGVSGAGVGSGAVGVGVGGLGGDGGDGGIVDSDVTGAISTAGANAEGVLVQSVGGGGGNGGMNVTATISVAGVGGGAGGVGFGGFGGEGGISSNVDSNVTGSVSTQGFDSDGVIAQSIGGGGGNGGMSITGTFSGAGVGSGAGSVGIGGFAGGGGDAGSVVSLVNADVSTGGDQAVGVMAQSVGGGGGNGGLGVTGTVSIAGVGSGAGGAGVGGFGGDGGVSGDVINTVLGSVSTAGADSSAVIAQAVGGGGGTGGVSVTGTISGGGVGSGAGSLAVGGFGGGGGSAGNVTNTIDADLTTDGAMSMGVLAQSVGGGGGNGGIAVSATASVAGVGGGAGGMGVGGFGGEGGSAGEVRNSVNGSVATAGELASGILVQSIGGGGGNGGLSVQAAFSGAGAGSGAGGVAVGGVGGKGGDGNLVINNVDATVATTGNQSIGVLTQSVGGGGGNGGIAIAGNASVAGVGGGAGGMAVGGVGGSGGVGAVVENTVAGSIATAGTQSAGVVAQSVGGGGGNGGLSVAGTFSGAGTGSGAVSVSIGGIGGSGGMSSTVENTVNADVSTQGELSTGVLAQSVGGGGGNGGISVSSTVSVAGVGSGAGSFGLGGIGGGGGSADTVTNTVNGSVQTLGDDAAGVVAQSVGGGGGNGGLSVAATLSGAGTGSGAVSVAVGGFGGLGGGSGNVINTVDADISTAGQNATGVLAQSVGGGGGNGGIAVAGSVSVAGTGSGAASLGVGGMGGGGGTSADVSNTVAGSVSTSGEQARGIVAQSIGGGGGSGGLSVAADLSGAGTGSGAVSIGVGGFAGGGGDAGSVSNDVDVSVATAGSNAIGVLAQSVGGGGGAGGIAIAGNASVAGTGGGSAAIGVGGMGGDGGNAAAVTNAVAGTVTTTGDEATAILAQSVGGGGGSGGLSVAGTFSGTGTGSAAASVAIGGFGGDGGSASTVNNSVNADVATAGDNAAGVLAQSVGGGGGSGGISIAGTVSVAGTGSGAASLGLGGLGGGGGQAAAVTNQVAGTVSTGGDSASGIVAQSVGGGGGNGGLSVAGTLSAAGKGGGAASVAIGGFGGAGGDGARVDSDVDADVTTTGEFSTGVLTQSVGGGGGNGGIGIAAAVSLAGTGSGAASLGLGGFGGDGGNAGLTEAEVTGTILTSGANAPGVVTQSVGGGGGNGGLTVSASVSAARSGSGSLTAGVGGAGGGGGDSAGVDASVQGYVQTAGVDSSGILTQSVGGGGGSGGTSIAGTFSGAGKGSGAVAIAVGGFGGDGGNAAAVTSDVQGGVLTVGDRSSAILTQSVGGGGGNGGVSVSGAVSFSKESGGALALGVGGFGGGGGDAAAVASTVATTETFSQVATQGQDAPAVVAQSIGGGGGNGGINVSAAVNIAGKSGAAIGVGVGGFGGGGGSGSDVTLDVAGDVATSGTASHGVIAQSLGGGGGNGGVNVTGALSIAKEGSGGSASIGVGGFGGGGGDAGDVDLTYRGTLVASGGADASNGSHGLLAQSLGGGGGNGGVNVSAGLSFASTKNDGDGNALVVGVGGFGGGGGDAGAVDVTVNQGSSIAAFGDDRSAIFVQSIGGGGGNGGVNVSAGIAMDAPIVFGMGGFGGDGGTAGAVNVDATADLTASGKNGRGIFAQSVGGGGGNGGLNVSGAISFAKEATPPSVTIGLGGFGGAGNAASTVGVAQAGNISTNGQDAHGIFAQSVGGGGGNGGVNVSTALILADNNDSGGYKDVSFVMGMGGHGGEGADASDTTVFSSGDISTSGDYARGIFAQSVGGGGGNGGFNFSGNIAQKSSLINVGVGGFGAGAGNAGDVLVQRGAAEAAAGKITTNGVGAIGIESTSIGGGGGDAGGNILASVLWDKGSGSDDDDNGGDDGDDNKRPHPKHTGVDPEVFTNYDKVLDELEGRQKQDKETEKDKKEGDSAFAAQIAIGGAGGGAGQGAKSTVDNHGDIETFQQQSHGILAQSIGGGGGNAAFNIGLTYVRKESKNKGLNIALGGATGDGGSGAEVLVNHDGAIETHGDDSFGVVAQSIGGGGGNAVANMTKTKGKMGKIDVSIGRRGGSGGEGGDVALNSAGSVITHGDRSWGLLAQSIGNGGGNSSSITVSVETEEKDETPSRGASVSVGLEGGVGGTAGDVTLTAEDLVMTQGSQAHAIFAQSVGGGGGNGGDAKGTSANASVAIGGSGGTGGTGGVVDIDSSADVRTLGTGAIGIIGQSIGGGGGTGGKSEAEIEGSEIGVAFALGGVGGTGSASGLVTVDNSGVIITDGKDAHGILAQSLGGGGGNGSMSVTSLKSKEKEDDDKDDKKDNDTTGTNGDGDDEEQKPSLEIGVAIGGAGGTGAAAEGVAVTNTGGIGTQGDDAVGIYAQSVGGGGGNASQVVNKVSGSGGKVSVGVGGSGGEGGTGGNVQVSNLSKADGTPAQIITVGDRSHGIFAMSIGGGGGTGSTVISEDETKPKDAIKAKNPTLGLSVKVGGAGGTGGTGGDVTVNNQGEIVTMGKQAHGIMAQSVGGGGGNGGVSYTKNTGLNANKGINSDISIGGAGGTGNVAGDVVVDNSGAIETFGDRSFGIFAQSIGGGGGNGGMAGASYPESDEKEGEIDTEGEPEPQLSSIMNFTLGGEGGDGADGGDVTVNHTGSILVHGDDSYGIYAQSVGGGGGTVGATYSSPIGTATEFLLPLLLGSRDGGTGEAGIVTIDTVGDITMLGDNSYSHRTQSVNGGGGDLNISVDVSQVERGQVTTGPEPEDNLFKAAFQAVLGIGSEAVENGLGSAIKSDHVGDLVAVGKKALGLSSQSVGGGGGNGNVDLRVNDRTKVDLELLLGGKNSTNSGGGDIDLSRVGEISTQGDLSKGGSVQSIGGGGGDLNVTVNRVALPQEQTQAATASARQDGASFGIDKGVARIQAEDEDFSGSATLQMGSDGSSGNHGGSVSLMFSGDVTTEGVLSPGLLVQSIGAGGGDVRLEGLDDLIVTMGGSNGASGDGGDILLANFGDVVTSGELSHGVLLQSVGGGGGSVFTDLSAQDVTIELGADSQGSGGAIDFQQNGDIVSSGARSIGLLAQSLGGGGGVVDRAFMGAAGGAGDAGDISLALDGSVIASGFSGVAVAAQSQASDTQGDIDVLLEAEHTIFGGEQGVGIWLSGGNQNTITNFGDIMTADGVDGLALLADDGNNLVDNFGNVVGEIDLGASASTFTNHEGAVFVPGAVVGLGGPDGILINNGDILPGASGRAESVALNGAFLQNQTGASHLEIDFFTNQIDQVNATGDVDLDGTVAVRLINTRYIRSGKFTKEMFTSQQTLRDNGFFLDVLPSAVVDYSYLTTSQRALVNYEVDFAPGQFGKNLRRVGDFINRAQNAGVGSEAYGDLISELVTIPDTPQYRDALSQLSPEFYAEHQVRMLNRSIQFAQRLMSCEQQGGKHRFTREGNCIWLYVGHENHDRDSRGDYKSVDGKTQSVAVGMQSTAENDWSFGVGIARARADLEGYGNRWDSEGVNYQFGFTAKRRYGPTKWSAVLSYSTDTTDTNRRGSLLGGFLSDTTRDMDVWSGMLRLSHDFAGEKWFWRPILDVGVLHLITDSATETGAGGANLRLTSEKTTQTWARPAFELGSEFEAGSDAVLRVNLSVGARYFLDEEDVHIDARFSGAFVPGVQPMSVPVQMGEPSYDAGLGVEYLTKDNLKLELLYNHEWSSDRTDKTVALKLSYPF